MVNARILLAENDETFRNEVTELLETSGFEVISAPSKDVARKVLNEQSPELTLGIFDIRLTKDDQPRDLSGLDVAQEAWRELPKIIVTNHINDKRHPDIYFEITRRIGEIQRKSYPAAVKLVWKNDISTSPITGADNRLVAEIRSVLAETAQAKRQLQEQAQREVSTLLSDDIKSELRGFVAHEIRSTLYGEPLDNYQGFVCVQLLSRGKTIQPTGEDKLLKMAPDQAGQLVVQFNPEQPKDCLSETIHIRDGQNVEQTTFEVDVESDEFRVTPTSQLVIVTINQVSKSIEFSFVAPLEAKKYEAWLRVRQKNRRIQFLPFTVEVVKPPISK